MGRVEKFKAVRKFKARCVFILILFLVLTFAGICVSDYSINTLMRNQKRISLVTLESKENSKMVINLLNTTIRLDTSYIDKDLKKIKEMLNNIFK